jgi:hypothetical protein
VKDKLGSRMHSKTGVNLIEARLVPILLSFQRQDLVLRISIGI